MVLNDSDFEFVFAMYDSAIRLLSDKDKPAMAQETIRHMIESGVDIRLSAPEISDHCEMLEDEITEYLEGEEEDGYESEFEYEDEEYDY